MNERGSAPEQRPFDQRAPLPMCGRDHERRLIAAAMDELAGGRAGEGLVLAGLVGSGRSRLAAWAVDHARASGWLVGFVAVTCDVADELWSVAATLAGELRALRPGALSVRSLQQLLDSPPEPLPAAARHLGRRLAEAAEECRASVFLVVDDADRWRAATAPSLSHLQAPAERGLPLLTVATTLAATPLGGQANRHVLGPLSVQDLLDAPLGLSQAAAVRLVGASGGWPAVIEALLAQPEVEWAVQGMDHFEQIAAALPPAQRRYLETVANLGTDPVSVATVAKALGDSTRFSAESSTLASVRTALIEQELLYVVGDDGVDIAVAGLREHLSVAGGRQ